MIYVCLVCQACAEVPQGWVGGCQCPGWPADSQGTARSDGQRPWLGNKHMAWMQGHLHPAHTGAMGGTTRVVVCPSGLPRSGLGPLILGAAPEEVGLSSQQAQRGLERLCALWLATE